MYPFQINNLAPSLQNAVYLPLHRRQTIIHKLPYRLLRNRCACVIDNNSSEIQGFAEDSDLSQFFYHTRDNRILKAKFLWYEDEDTKNSLRGFFFLRNISESIPYHLRIRKIKLCKTTGDLLLLADNDLDFLRHDAISGGLIVKRNVRITPELRNSNFAQEPSRAMPGSFQPSNPHDLAYLFYNEKAIYSVKNEEDVKVELSYQQLTNLPNVTLGHGRGGERFFNALASASKYDCGNKLLAYLAVGEKFSLVNFSSQELELINFGDASRQSHCSTIRYVQCLLREGNERCAVIVQRSNRSIEMWDDRQPRSPCLSFDSTALTQPAIELPLQSMIAFHRAPDESVKLYSLRTGELVNTMKYSHGLCTDCSPKLVFRTKWFYNCNEACPPGPVVMLNCPNRCEYFL